MEILSLEVFFEYYGAIHGRLLTALSVGRAAA